MSVQSVVSRTMERDPTEIRDERATPTMRLSWRSLLAAAIPTPVALAALDVRIEADELTTAPGEPLDFAIILRNRLPVPIAFKTPTPLLWGWEIDGRYKGGTPPDPPAQSRTVSFGPLETKHFPQRWHGRFRDAAESVTWLPADPDEYELTAFLKHPAAERYRLVDSVLVQVE